MQVIFIRHGETDYTEVTEKEFIAHGRDLAPLSRTGKRNAVEIAGNAALNGVQLILSSPYTRALQTAAIISRIRDIDLEVEVDLHEWLPDLLFEYDNDEFIKNAIKLCNENKGICPVGSPIRYENLETVFNRASRCLNKYLDYDKIAVVAHGILFRQFTSSKKLHYGDIFELEYDEGFQWCGFVN